MTHVCGFYRAIVIDVSDPSSTNKVRVRIPQLFGDAATGWVPAVGSPSTPALGSVVWVAFEAGDPDAPLWLGQA